ncbi:hypothetical protein ACO22_07576 [Paracoccidioides brasiliensis]|uniref:Uncharacterized protein n=1 Tax=Paracoccidioides brasiliensis TaxID=121759 RepID=A0A1D2J4A0_PARBR|nr:hypothetical protein ACO22_07576 [Paracoccidioides brasiliensis]
MPETPSALNIHTRPRSQIPDPRSVSIQYIHTKSAGPSGLARPPAFSPEGPLSIAASVFPNNRAWFMGGLELRCQFTGWKWKWSCFFVTERGILRAAEPVDHARTAGSAAQG